MKIDVVGIRLVKERSIEYASNLNSVTANSCRNDCR